MKVEVVSSIDGEEIRCSCVHALLTKDVDVDIYPTSSDSYSDIVELNNRYGDGEQYTHECGDDHCFTICSYKRMSKANKELLNLDKNDTDYEKIAMYNITSIYNVRNKYSCTSRYTSYICLTSGPVCPKVIVECAKSYMTFYVIIIHPNNVISIWPTADSSMEDCENLLCELATPMSDYKNASIPQDKIILRELFEKIIRYTENLENKKSKYTS